MRAPPNVTIGNVTVSMLNVQYGKREISGSDTGLQAGTLLTFALHKVRQSAWIPQYVLSATRGVADNKQGLGHRRADIPFALHANVSR